MKKFQNFDKRNIWKYQKIYYFNVNLQPMLVWNFAVLRRYILCSLTISGKLQQNIEEILLY